MNTYTIVIDPIQEKQMALREVGKCCMAHIVTSKSDAKSNVLCYLDCHPVCREKGFCLELLAKFEKRLNMKLSVASIL